MTTPTDNPSGWQAPAPGTAAPAVTSEPDSGKLTDRGALDAYDGARCPRCSTGLLRVTSYDPDATHEAGQAQDKVPFEPSGGSLGRWCFNCGYRETVPLSTSPERVA